MFSSYKTSQRFHFKGNIFVLGFRAQTQQFLAVVKNVFQLATWLKHNENKTVELSGQGRRS